MDPHTPKVCLPFLARAKELATKDPVIAYWCKFMAAKVALDQLDSLDDAGKAALEDVMGDLEQSKAALADNELVTDDTAGSAYIYNFASRVFDRADATDRAGKATRATAKEFLAASNFFEIMSLFGPLETDVNEKIAYSKWKASSIAKAFREGRTPTPGPANAGGTSSPSLPAASADGDDQHSTNDSSEDVSRQLLGGSSSGTSQPHQHDPSTKITDLSQDQDDDEVMDSRFALPPPPNENPGSPPRALPSVPDIPTSPTFSSSSSQRNGHHPSAPPDEPDFSSFPSTSSSRPSAPSFPSQPPSNSAPAPRASAPPPLPAAPASQPQSYAQRQEESWQPEPTSIDPMVITKAQKHAKWAISALNYEDLETARKELRNALALIGG